jgi:hypothetical protein
MQRQIIDGIPYFVDAQHRLFNWDTEASPQHIGTYDPATKRIVFLDNYLSPLADRLQDWRGKQQPRLRKQPKDGGSTDATSSGGNTGSSAASTENSDAE